MKFAAGQRIRATGGPSFIIGREGEVLETEIAGMPSCLVKLAADFDSRGLYRAETTVWCHEAILEPVPSEGE